MLNINIIIYGVMKVSYFSQFIIHGKFINTSVRDAG